MGSHFIADKVDIMSSRPSNSPKDFIVGVTMRRNRNVVPELVFKPTNLKTVAVSRSNVTIKHYKHCSKRPKTNETEETSVARKRLNLNNTALTLSNQEYLDVLKSFFCGVLDLFLPYDE